MKTLAAIAAIIIAAATVQAAEVTVRWTFATHNMDGTPLTDLAGAKVYYGTASSNYTHVVDVPGGEPGETKGFTVTGLVAGVTYYLNGTAYNTAGLESDFCDEVAKTAFAPEPPPTWPVGVSDLASVTPIRIVQRAVFDGARWTIEQIIEAWTGTEWEVK